MTHNFDNETLRLHLLTLAVSRREDIPLIRQKAKHLSEFCEFNLSDKAVTAVAASEISRIVLEIASGGTVSFALLSVQENSEHSPRQAGIEIHAKGKSPLNISAEKFGKSRAWTALKNVMDRAIIESCGINRPLELKVMKIGSFVNWDRLINQSKSMRDKLFSNTRESYIFNLRAKHEELLILLEQISAKNMELDKANQELLNMSHDLEVMAHERTVSEMALKIADNVRNPVTVIGGLIKSVLKKLTVDSPQRKKLEVVFKEAEKLERIVKEFDSLADTMYRLFEKKDLKDLVEEVLTGRKTFFEKKNINLLKNLAQLPVMAIVESNTLKVAIRHLIDNAIEASPEGGELRVDVDLWDGAPRIAIQDQGGGVPDEIKDLLFKESVSTKSTGAGMGLLTVKQIMLEHQGDIGIENIPGQGACVTMTFPVRWRQHDSLGK